MSGRLAGRVAPFITGAARGQGRAHAVRMATEDADIIAVAIAGKLPECVPYDPATPEDLAETVRLVGATDRRIIASVVDTRDFGRLREAVRDGVATLGRLDIIVANAGISAPQVWNDIKPEDFRDVMDINVTGTWNRVMAGAQRIIDGGRGGPVNTAMGSGDMVVGIAKAAETNPQLPSWVAQPEDIADAVCGLASDESRNVTAAQISVDQGSTQY